MSDGRHRNSLILRYRQNPRRRPCSTLRRASDLKERLAPECGTRVVAPEWLAALFVALFVGTAPEPLGFRAAPPSSIHNPRRRSRRPARTCDGQKSSPVRSGSRTISKSWKSMRAPPAATSRNPFLISIRLVLITTPEATGIGSLPIRAINQRIRQPHGLQVCQGKAAPSLGGSQGLRHGAAAENVLLRTNRNRRRTPRRRPMGLHTGSWPRRSGSRFPTRRPLRCRPDHSHRARGRRIATHRRRWRSHTSQ